ncbi:glycosyltransferase family 4 protein [Swingsia samuiensis]|uniref:Glycosyltransferase n=1 Tax=Swingsia samuiensis TaxID=1293412 RepID=A0A4Y6UHE6_9PROT|nr:glycosyltransferase family 4 protein [Swingsia samuiensis]QDH17019.1 glycosyltransferase [Swingsia samuiensis]
MFQQQETILQVLPALETGGLERGAIEIAGAVKQAGGRALIASRGGALLPQLRYVGGQHIPLDLKKKSLFSIFRRARDLQKIILKENVMLVHARSRIPAWSAWLACRRTGVPLVTTWHGVHHASWWGKKLYNSSLVKGQRVIAISEFIAERLRREYHVSEERLRVIPRGADALYFNPEAISGERIQKVAEAWSLPLDYRVILMPARLTRWKGQGVLLEALTLLKKKQVDHPWICVFVGPVTDKKFAKYLLHRIRELDLSNDVYFAGNCQDMPAAYALSSVVVTPSLRPEPFGRTVVEAQMMGKPVIGTAQGGMMETIIPEQTGLVVPPNDPEALSDALCAVLGLGSESSQQISENARQNALDHYTTQSMQAMTLAVYDEILGTQLSGTFLGRDYGRPEE